MCGWLCGWECGLVEPFGSCPFFQPTTSFILSPASVTSRHAACILLLTPPAPHPTRLSQPPPNSPTPTPTPPNPKVYRDEATPVEDFFKERGLLLDFEITGGIPETLPRLLAALEPHIARGGGRAAEPAAAAAGAR